MSTKSKKRTKGDNKTVKKIRKRKVTIICPIHNTFQQDIDRNYGEHICSRCIRQDQFIRNANKQHDNSYIYKNVIYVDCKTNVTITCPIHGDFSQRPQCHLRGSGCRKCNIMMIKKYESDQCESDQYESETDEISEVDRIIQAWLREP